MPNYLAPGVYVEEVPGTARAIGQVSSSIAGFVGVAPNADARLNDTVVLDNWTQFVDIFVGDATAGTPLSNAVFGFFNNGGGRCYVVNIGEGGSLTGTAAETHGPAQLRDDRRHRDRGCAGLCGCRVLCRADRAL